MSKSEYFKACMKQELLWLLACARQPSPYMSQTHLRLVRLAIRKREAGLSGYMGKASSFVDVGTISEYGLTQKLSNAIRVF